MKIGIQLWQQTESNYKTNYSGIPSSSTDLKVNLRWVM